MLHPAYTWSSSTIFLLYFLVVTNTLSLAFLCRHSPVSRREINVKGVAWEFEGLNQQDLLYRDECLVVDVNDIIIDHATKYEGSYRYTS